MFERLVTQVLHGYLGRYVKDFHKHQLKITIWNEEVFLENVELSLEAFDYLQLPFALKQGRIGKISIKIPWKKLGWEPFVISLENVFLCASQRDDEEWSLDEVEKREFAGKKAKLAAAELAKLSKRVCENQAGFILIITAKIIDSIQVSIRDFHILYHDKLSGSRGLMALADVEGARIHLKQLTIAHQIASLESLREILMRHYTRQLVHEMYKVFGSASVIGNPMGFARSLGLGIRDFLSVPARSIFQSPTGLITGMAQGTTSLLSNTVYAISDAATQFSKAAHKGIVAFTFDDQAVSEVQQQQTGITSHSKGVINEVFEGLTGLLQSPINGAEKHGLPGVLSGIALGITGLVAKPAASILEVTGKTAQSIRNRSRTYQTRQQRFRVRLPRPLSQEYPLRPYCWEEAVGASVLVEADGSLRLKDEIFVTCKKLKEAGKYVIITERLVLIVSCSSLVDLGKPEFRGVPSDLEWVIESEIHLESVIHADCDQGVVHIVGSSSNTPLRQNQLAKRSSGTRAVRWNNPTVPLIQTNVEIEHKDAENLLQVLSSTIELGKDQGWGCRNILHRSNIK